MVNTELSDILSNLESKVNTNTDIGRAMEEFFKDHIDNDTSMHDIDLRSRLVGKAIRGHSVINFLGSMKINEVPNKDSLAEGLSILSISLKRHVLSLEGKSRTEIIDLFKSKADAERPTSNFNLSSPVALSK